MKRLRPHTAAPRIARDDEFKVAGLRAVEALFAARPHAVRRLFFTREMAGAAKPICAALARARRPFRQVGDEELSRIAGTMHTGGIVAIAAPLAMRAPSSADIAAWAAERAPLLVLDGVANPHNFGAILRSAAFLGVRHVVLSERPEQAVPSEAALRVAAGGLEHVVLWRPPALAPFLRPLKARYRTIAASPRGLPLARLPGDRRPTALVLGNEETGLSPAVARECEQAVAIAGSGKVESLNVSVAAAILIHALLTPAPGGR
jgi:TrmH RNA methyltransferase